MEPLDALTETFEELTVPERLELEGVQLASSHQLADGTMRAALRHVSTVLITADVVVTYCWYS